VTLSVFVVHALWVQALLPGQKRKRRFAARNLAFYSRAMLWLFGIRVRLEGSVDAAVVRGEKSAGLLVCNHLSYVDVMILAAQYPALFVTSVEVQQTPGLGQICKAGGSYFVERRNRTKLAQELSDLQNILHSGQSHLAVFPEATSSNGEGVLPFKNALFDSAVRSQSRVLPMCLQYVLADGKRLDRKLRDSIFYYGEMTFLSHFVRLLKLRTIDVVLTVHEPIPVDSSTSRKELSDRAWQKISTTYGAPFGSGEELTPLLF
jgi:1-acyl-sn-glycerol-3-phosphate acyltransferase